MNLFLLFLFLYLGGQPACAQITGATHLLSRGPGAEAAALGSSVVSTIQDPTALFWNPAGLAHAGGTITGEHLFLFGGARYDFIGLSLPSSFATFGLGALELNRSNIIARTAIDDLGNQVSNTQSNYMPGLARKLGDHWAVGAAANILNFNLAGYHDTGFGLDLGTQATYPTGDIGPLGRTLCSFGSVFKSLWEPTLRLNTDQETFPRELRAGGSFSFETLSRLSPSSGEVQHDRVTVSTALTRVFHQPGLHLGLGLSYLLCKILVLRLGYDQGVAGGIGLRTADQKFVLDYALEAKPLSLNNRFTLSYRFSGPRFSPEMPASTERDDDYLVAKNRAESLAEENEARGKELFNQRNYENALEPLELASLLDPENSELKNFHARAQEVARRDKIRSLSETVQRSMASADYAAAYKSIAQLLDLDAANRSKWVLALQTLADRMPPTDFILLSSAAFADQKGVATERLSSGFLSEAERLAQNLELLQSTQTASGVAELKNEITRQASQNRAELEALIAQALPSGQYAVALQAALALSRAFPDNPNITQRVQDIRGRYLSRLSLSAQEELYLRKLYYLAAIGYARKDYPQAENLLEEILRRDGAEEQAQTLKETLIRKGLLREEVIHPEGKHT